MRQQLELHFTKGQTLKAGGYDVTFVGVDQRQEPHRVSTVGIFDIARDGKPVTRLEPRMNQYQMMREPIGSPDVHTTAARDFYISLSNIDSASERASITVFISPMIVWIWLAVIVMALGALFSLIPAARRSAVVVTEAKEPLPGTPETA